MASPHHPHQVARALTLTLSNDASQRHAAESLLSNLANDDRHASDLLTLATSSDPVVASAAALRLKNLMRASRACPLLSDNSRSLIRDNLLPALAAATATNVEGVLAETARWLVLIDFPSRWPKLFPSISDYLRSNDPKKIHAALTALRQLVKVYEFKSRDPLRLDPTDPNDAGLSHPREPLDSIAAACFPTLLALYAHLDLIVAKPPSPSDVNGRRSACLAQRLIVKIFWSCTQFILPPCLADDHVLDQWLSRFYETLRRPSQVPYKEDPDELAMEPEWKTKKWIAQVISKFLKRYGSPQKAPMDEQWTIAVAKAFKERHAEQATKVMLDVLTSTSDGHQLSKRVAHLALDFIEEAIETASLWAIIRPHVDTLLTRVAFPYLCFVEADEETWVSDPTEYVRKQYDFTDDFTSPRMAASNLLTKMSDLRSKSTILPFLRYLLQNVLDPYNAAPVGSQQRSSLARQKVGAFASLAAVKGKLMSKKELSSSLLSVLKSHVEPDMRSEFGFLRSESVWLLGQVASCEWDEFSEELGESSLRGCVALLQDSELPVQAAAAGALEYLMEQEGSVALIKEVATRLLEKLLQLIDSMADGYMSILPALDKLVVRYPDEIMPLAIPLVQRLMSAFGQSAHGILTDGDDEDDELAFASAQVLHLISSVISGVGEWSKPTKEEKAAVFRAIERELHPLLESMFQESHQVFVEELLDVLGSLIVQTGELHGSLPPALISLIPKMVSSFHEWAADYVGHMINALQGYLRYDLHSVIRLDGGMQGFMSIITKLWSPKFDDSDAIFGAKIADVLILYLSKLRPLTEELTQRVIVEVARSAASRYVQTGEDQTVLRQRLFAVVMLCCYVDAPNVLSGLGPTSVMQLVAAQTNNLQLFDRIHSKKSVIMGVGAILCTRGLIVEESKPHLLNLALRLKEMIDEQRAAASQSAENAGQNLASLVKGSETNGISTTFETFGQADTDVGSDLGDDEDASNFVDDMGHNGGEGLERLAAGTGLPVAVLEQLQSNGGFDGGLFEFDALDDSDDDEGAFEHNALDDINEVDYLVKSVKQAAVDAWWAKVSERDRAAMEKIARELER
eukprot:GFKZ01009466.1.p1 GENE.GFKZ01009466.1~~GFKZ01009466.1.p1  ORF type:complete len:1119 (-),score=184.80 GFKZ01009466.1:1386-4634(-)